MQKYWSYSRKVWVEIMQLFHLWCTHQKNMKSSWGVTARLSTILFRLFFLPQSQTPFSNCFTKRIRINYTKNNLKKNKTLIYSLCQYSYNDHNRGVLHIQYQLPRPLRLGNWLLVGSLSDELNKKQHDIWREQSEVGK